METAKIEKDDDGKTISLSYSFKRGFSFKKNFLFLKLNDEKTKLNLIIDDGRTFELNAKTENNKLNIYESLIEKAIKEDSFLLCITPHCDCLRPEKIDNCFYFVGGKKLDLSSGLKKGDTDFISYIQIENEIICIEWKTTPFTIHIPNENKIIPPIECDLSGKKIRLKHITWQKENYSQRIANQSFSYASRVGINLAGLHK